MLLCCSNGYKCISYSNISNFNAYYYYLCANCSYLIVESVSFVLLQDVSPIHPKKTIEIINSRDVSV